MLNGTNMLGKDNPRWPIGNATETIKVPDAGALSPRAPGLPGTEIAGDPLTAVADAVRNAAAIAVAWLKGLPRRAGNRLFRKNDEEARWRGWQVTELAGGLGRQYRDPRFDMFREQLDPHGGRVEPDSRHGMESGTQPGGRVQALSEAWEDHGCPGDGDL